MNTFIANMPKAYFTRRSPAAVSLLCVFPLCDRFIAFNCFGRLICGRNSLSVWKHKQHQ